jgi:hypothetical protein
MAPERITIAELDRRLTRLENDTTARLETVLRRYNAALGELTSAAEQSQQIESLDFRVARLEDAADDGRNFRRQMIIALVGVVAVVLGAVITVILGLVFR